MSEFKTRIKTKLHALWYAYFSNGGDSRPVQAGARLWDQLGASGQRVSASVEPMRTAISYSMACWCRTLFPYEYLFRAVNTHILAEVPLTGDCVTDQTIIFDALRWGRAWVGCDVLGSTRGFQFEARSGVDRVTVGNEIRRAGAVTLEVTVPLPGDIQLIYNGQVVRRAVRARRSSFL